MWTHPSIGWQVERYGFNSELVVDGGFGEDSDHVAVLDEFEQNVDLVELDAYVELSGPGREIMVKSIASLKAFGWKREIVTAQIGDANTLLASKRMSIAHDDGKMIVKQDVRLYLFDSYRWTERQHEIDRARLEHLHKLGHRFVEDIEPYVGVFAGELYEGLGEYGAERVGHAYVERARGEIGEVVDACDACVGVIHRAPRIGEEFLSGFGQAYGMGVTLKELYAELVLKLLHLLRQCALRKVEQFGGFYVIFYLTEFNGCKGTKNQRVA